MIRSLAACLLGLALFTGCGDPGGAPAMHKLSMDFRDTFIAELKKLGTYTEAGTSAGGSESVFTSALEFEVEGEGVKGLDILSFGNQVRAKWGKEAGFSSHGGGGGGRLFAMEFGNEGEYAFIDVVAQPTEKGMSFLFLVRVTG